MPASRNATAPTRDTRRDDTRPAAPHDNVVTGGVLLLTTNTGGGHRASAEALRQELLACGRSRTIVLDPMNGPAGSRALRALCRLYGPLVSHAPWLWGLLFHASNVGPVRKAMTALVSAGLRRSLHHALQQHQPEVIAVFHPLLVAPAVAVRGPWSDITIVTVVTDLGTPHRTWWHPDVDHVVVPRVGLSPSGPNAHACEHPFGLLVRRQFTRGAHRPGRDHTRQRLGLAPDRFVVMVSGGGEGARGTGRWARALATGSADVDVVVVCGRNERLRASLSRLRPKPGRRFVVAGFVEDMATWMSAADLLVTKAGPGTIAEAAALGLPVLLAGHLPGQEAGNGAAVLRVGGGLEANSTRDVVARVEELSNSPELLRHLSASARHSGRSHAAALTADLIHQLMEPNR